MRGGAGMLIGLSGFLCACHAEPDFDERYTEAEKAIQQKAAEMDEDLEGSIPAGPSPGSATEPPSAEARP